MNVQHAETACLRTCILSMLRLSRAVVLALLGKLYLPSAKDSVPAGHHYRTPAPADTLPVELSGALPPQFDNQWYLALVNKLADEVAKAGGSVHTFAQVQLLRSVVRALPAS